MLVGRIRGWQTSAPVLVVSSLLLSDERLGVDGNRQYI